MSTVHPSMTSRPHRSGARQPSRRGSTFRTTLMALALVVPVVEVAVLVAAGHAVGLGWTVAALVLMSLLGTWLMRHEGISTWRSLRRASQEGRVPTDEVTDAGLLLVGGLLLALPGFVSDVAALVLLVPATRAPVRRAVQRRIAGNVSPSLVRVVRQDRAGAGPSDASRMTVEGQVRPVHVDLRPESERRH